MQKNEATLVRRKLGAYLGVKTHRRNPKGVKVIRKSELSLSPPLKGFGKWKNPQVNGKKNLRKWNDQMLDLWNMTTHFKLGINKILC